ncbi:MAG TPA: hypothetical protein VIE35_04495, partial [Dongiaceae bacterium]
GWHAGVQKTSRPVTGRFDLMVDSWLSGSTVGIVLIPILLLFSIAAAIVWLTHLSPARPFFASCIGILGPFFASVGLLFGLFAAFLANDVQHQNAEIKSAVFREADGIRTLLRLAEALGDTGRPLEAATLGYAQSVLNNEWPAMQQPGSATEFLGALRNLARAVLAPDLIAAVPTAVHQTILDGMVEIRQARRDRLSLLAGESDSMSWLAMLILGVLTQVAVAVVQLDRLRPQALALFVFTSAFAATVVLIGLSEARFSRGDIDATALRAAVASATP